LNSGLLLTDGRGKISTHCGPHDERTNNDNDHQFRRSRCVLPRPVHGPPPHDIVNGSGTIAGKHVHYTIGVKGKDLLNCYASVESHTFCYNLLCNEVKKGFSYGDHTR